MKMDYTVSSIHTMPTILTVECTMREVNNFRGSFCYPSICEKGLRKPRKLSVRIAGVSAEIQNQNLESISVKDYCYTILLGCQCSSVTG
jgi:hypothetical protein